MAILDEIASSLDNKNQADTQEQEENRKLQRILDSQTNLQHTVNAAIQALMNFQAAHEPNVTVKNQKDFPKSIKTPDVQAVVDALKSLELTTSDTKPDNSELLKALADLQTAITELPAKIDIPEAPEPVEEVTVKNQPDYKPDFDKVTKAVKSIDVKPAVTVTQEKTIVDLKPVVSALDTVVQAVGNIPKPPEVDLSEVTTATDSVRQAIQALRFPVPNYVLPFKDVSGKAVQAQLDANGYLHASNGGLTPSVYDYAGFSNPDANGNYQTINYKSGGAGGTIVTTLTLSFDGSNNVTSIAKS